MADHAQTLEAWDLSPGRGFVAAPNHPETDVKAHKGHHWVEYSNGDVGLKRNPGYEGQRMAVAEDGTTFVPYEGPPRLSATEERQQIIGNFGNLNASPAVTN